MMESSKIDRSVTFQKALNALEQLQTRDCNEKSFATFTIEYLTALPPEERETFLDTVVQLIEEKFGTNAVPSLLKAVILKAAGTDWVRMGRIKSHAENERKTAARHAEMTPEEITQEVRKNERLKQLRESLPYS